MPLPLYYFLAITAVNVLMSWALYLPYRVAHLHFITVANMAISGYAAGVPGREPCTCPSAWALLAGFALGRARSATSSSLFIGDAPTFAVVIVGFTFIYITRTVIENTEGRGGHDGHVRPARASAARPPVHRWAILGILYGARGPGGVPDPPLRPLAASAAPPRRCSSTRTSPPRSGSTSGSSGILAADLQLHPGGRVRGALRLHLQEPPPGLLHLPPGGHLHDRHLRGRLRHPVGDRPGRRADALRRAAAVPARDRSRGGS
ncbi:MAG: hypothetical protein MZU95_04590 [Desulfomicrobium escambiense]|nr:hypothetical protein [Desulfomicrobium escambiense]